MIGAGTACGSHQAFGELGEIGLVEKGLHFLAGLCGEEGQHKSKMWGAGAPFNRRRAGMASCKGRFPSRSRGRTATACQACDVFAPMIPALNQGS